MCILRAVPARPRLLLRDCYSSNKGGWTSAAKAKGPAVEQNAEGRTCGPGSCSVRGGAPGEAGGQRSEPTNIGKCSNNQEMGAPEAYSSVCIS